MKNFVVLTAFVIIVLGSGQAAWAQENFDKIDQFLDFAFTHARNFPPEFDAPGQKETLEKGLPEAMAELEQMLKSATAPKEVLLRLGMASTFAFNLDLPESPAKADKYFSELFKLDPVHPVGNLFYGQHLSGRGEFKAAVEHLQIAADAGIDIALNMIGMAYVQMGNKEQARAAFLQFQKKHPEDPQVKVLIDALEPSGEYQLEPMRK